jgi:hypothetical protein
MANGTWNVTGNAQNPPNAFLGTTDGNPVVIQTAGAERLRVDMNGNVGLANSAPTHTLHLAAGKTLRLEGGVSQADSTAYFSFGGWGEFGIDAFGIPNGRFVVAGNGNVGIGEPAPTSRLHVNGDIAVTGDVVLAGADCAEEFDLDAGEIADPGTVVVIDETGALRRSDRAYDKRVAGVISGAGTYRAGLILDRQPSAESRARVALVGKVWCKADAADAPIQVGDLLTTSSAPGHAMKAVDAVSAFGAVIGKALRPLAEGRALIPILIALQ